MPNQGKLNMQQDNPPPSSAVVEDYDRWNRWRKDEEHWIKSPLDYPWYESVYREIADYPACRVLEVGCGRGSFAIWLARKAPRFQITALDFSGAAIEIARADAASAGVQVEFIQGDAEALPIPNDSFDLVISCECMEHVPHPPQMADEIARVLRRGGRFCLTTENYFNGMLVMWLKCWLTGEPFNSGSGVQPRENFFFFWMVRGYLQNAGLEVERMESCHYQWFLLPRVSPAALCTKYFKATWARMLAFPFGRHMSFFGRKPR